MDLDTFRRLVSEEGRAALTDVERLSPIGAKRLGQAVLAVLEKLRKVHDPALARAALETYLLRQKATAKFIRAAEMFFTREALEQSSSETVASYRAGRFAGFSHVADLCCGIGGDLISLAGRSMVTGVDLDPLRLAMAEHNATVYGVRDRVRLQQANVRECSVAEFDSIFFDPSRRSGGKRRVSLKDYEPRMELVRTWRSTTPAIGVKVAPAVPWEEIAEWDAEAEFISLNGELKECVFWFGPLRTTVRRATLLPGSHTLAAESPASAAPCGEPLAVLYDPDPAVVRAGLVSNLAEQLNARSLDPSIAHLTSDRYIPTPFARAYDIDEAMPFHEKRLRERLRSLGVGHVTISKRGSAVDVNSLYRRLKLDGPEHRVLILTRVNARPFVMIGRAKSFDRTEN